MFINLNSCCVLIELSKAAGHTFVPEGPLCFCTVLDAECKSDSASVVLKSASRWPLLLWPVVFSSVLLHTGLRWLLGLWDCGTVHSHCHLKLNACYAEVYMTSH